MKGDDWSDWVEIQVKELLKSNGYVVTDVNRPNRDGAPMAEAKDEKFRLPDFEVQNGYGESNKYVEVKGKRDGYRVYGIKDEKRHGIEQPQYDDYIRFQEETGTPVWVFIYEDPTGQLLVGGLEQLSVRQRTQKLWPDAGGAVVFKRGQFEIYDPGFDSGQSKIIERPDFDPFNPPNKGQVGLGDFQ